MMNKETLIKLITKIKPEAIHYGYDYPTNADFSTASAEELSEFYHEIQTYTIDAIIAEMEASIAEVKASAEAQK